MIKMEKRNQDLHTQHQTAATVSIMVEDIFILGFGGDRTRVTRICFSGQMKLNVCQMCVVTFLSGLKSVIDIYHTFVLQLV